MYTTWITESLYPYIRDGHFLIGTFAGLPGKSHGNPTELPMKVPYEIAVIPCMSHGNPIGNPTEVPGKSHGSIHLTCFPTPRTFSGCFGFCSLLAFYRGWLRVVESRRPRRSACRRHRVLVRPCGARGRDSASGKRATVPEEPAGVGDNLQGRAEGGLGDGHSPARRDKGVSVPLGKEGVGGEKSVIDSSVRVILLRKKRYVEGSGGGI